MKPKYLIIALLLLLSCTSLHAQYINMGKVFFERKTSIHKLYEDNEWFSRNKDAYPKFITNNFEMTFTANNSYYKPGKETEMPKQSWVVPPGNENEVFMDFRTNTVTAKKPIFEQTFLIQDSMRKMKWKISEEFKTIANYKCRKAVTRICDSVYVVAFYTDDIPVSAGPEQFGGLPGMILQLAVPRLHTVWTATQVDIVAVTNPETPPFHRQKQEDKPRRTGRLLTKKP